MACMVMSSLQVEYPDGDSFSLELLLLPKLVQPKHAKVRSVV